MQSIFKLKAAHFAVRKQSFLRLEEIDFLRAVKHLVISRFNFEIARYGNPSACSGWGQA